ncbi:MAG: PAS domain S-box protein [Ignavibacteria bacterium]|nr:PAS domain S-box protein [Ignavibacteria bacterium]
MLNDNASLSIGIATATLTPSRSLTAKLQAAGYFNISLFQTADEVFSADVIKTLDFLFLDSRFLFNSSEFRRYVELLEPLKGSIVLITRKNDNQDIPDAPIVSLAPTVAYPFQKEQWDAILNYLKNYTSPQGDTTREDPITVKPDGGEVFWRLMELSSDAIWLLEFRKPIPINLDTDNLLDEIQSCGFIASCNNSFARLNGLHESAQIHCVPVLECQCPSAEELSSVLYELIRSNFTMQSYLYPGLDKENGKVTYEYTVSGEINDGHIYKIGFVRRIRFGKSSEPGNSSEYLGIFENALDGIYKSTIDGRFITLNPAMATLYGYTNPAEMIAAINNIPVQLYDSPGDRTKFIETLLGEGKVEAIETIAIRKDGTRFWISEDARLIYDVDNGVKHIEGIIEDISRRKHAENSLRESERRYRNLVEFSPEAIVVYTNDRIVYVNHAFVSLIGASGPEMILGKPPLSYIHPEYHLVEKDRQETLMNSFAQLPAIEEKIIKLDGTPIYVEVSSMSLIWNGHPAVQYIYRDMSEKKREELIRVSESAVLTMVAHSVPLRNILEKICELNEDIYPTSQCAVYLYNHDVISLAAAPSIDTLAAQQLESVEQTGIMHASAKYKMPFYIRSLAEEDQWQDYAKLVNMLGVQGCWAIPITDMRRSVYGVLAYYFPGPVGPSLLNERMAEHFVNLLTIVIEKRRLEDEIVILSSVARQTTNAVSILDMNFKIVWVNEGYEKLTGYKFEMVRGKSAFETLNTPDSDAISFSETAEQLRKGIPVRYRTYKYSREGRGFWVSVHIDLMMDMQRRHTGYIVIENDETETVLQELALREAKEKAEEASRLKSSFLANMSHEIRTPMNGILGFADILRDELLINEQQELYKFAETIYNSGKRLLNLLNDILDISRIEANRLDLEISRCQAEDILLKAITLLKPLAERKGITLEYSRLASASVMADDNRLYQVVNNVIGNAIKFTAQGSVEVSCQTLEGEKADKVEIVVQDSGRGIEAEFLPRIFEPFSQESSGFSRSHEGSGLGLAISQRLLRLMDGNIEIRSQIDIGTTVIITLPVAVEKKDAVQEDGQLSPDPDDLERLRKLRPRVLIVEDDPTSRSYFQLTLSPLVELYVAGNGNEAMETVNTLLKKKTPPQVLLIDIGLPEPWDGLILRKEILKRYNALRSTPMIAQTAYAMKDEYETFMREGFNAVLLKPINRHSLIHVLSQVLHPAE